MARSLTEEEIAAAHVQTYPNPKKPANPWAGAKPSGEPASKIDQAQVKELEKAVEDKAKELYNDIVKSDAPASKPVRKNAPTGRDTGSHGAPSQHGNHGTPTGPDSGPPGKPPPEGKHDSKTQKWDRAAGPPPDEMVTFTNVNGQVSKMTAGEYRKRYRLAEKWFAQESTVRTPRPSYE